MDSSDFIQKNGNIEWCELHKPQVIEEFNFSLDEINKIKKWITNYPNTKKILFIYGDSGVGKTCLANTILNQFKYNKIELNPTDIKGQKKIEEFFKKTLTYRNVIDMFHDGNSPMGILLDEIDTICKLSDKSSFSDFIEMLKENEKNESNKKKKKQTSFIKLKNPIICTSNITNDKKITEIKKYSEIIYLQKPQKKELFSIIDRIYGKYNKKIDDETKIDICDQCQGDIRQLLLLLEGLYCFSNENEINIKIYEEFKKCTSQKEESIQLLDITKKLMVNKLDYETIQYYFDMDCMLIPLMIYHNSIDYIKGCEDVFKKKLKSYKNVMKSLCTHDTIQTNIFEFQDWDNLYDIAALYGSVIPNYHFCQLKNKKVVEVEFTTLLNKVSQMYINKKMLNTAKSSITKLYFDCDQIIYLTEILLHYFDDFKKTIDNKEMEEKDVDEEEHEEEEHENEDIMIKEMNNLDIKENETIVSQKKTSSHPHSNHKLIKFMNYYNISLEDLENILKMDKLNRIIEKRKNKFTTRIKKIISICCGEN
jgi:adenylate kinase family enzyme